MTTALPVLGEEPTRVVLSFLSCADSQRSVGGASTGLREMTRSERLRRQRSLSDYELRAPPPSSSRGGVVHALATSFGTRRWDEVDFSSSLDGFFVNNNRKVLPRAPSRLDMVLNIDNRAVSSVKLAPIWRTYCSSCLATAPTDARDLGGNMIEARRRDDLVRNTGRACSCSPGSFVEYRLPFPVRVTHFRLDVGACRREGFTHWRFEVFQGSGFETLYCPSSEGNEPQFLVGARVIPVLNRDPALRLSDRFRILLLESPDVLQCMHLRGFELFGTIVAGSPDAFRPDV